MSAISILQLPNDDALSLFKRSSISRTWPSVEDYKFNITRARTTYSIYHAMQDYVFNMSCDIGLCVQYNSDCNKKNKNINNTFLHFNL